MDKVFPSLQIGLRCLCKISHLANNDKSFHWCKVNRQSGANSLSCLWFLYERGYTRQCLAPPQVEWDAVAESQTQLVCRVDIICPAWRRIHIFPDLVLSVCFCHLHCHHCQRSSSRKNNHADLYALWVSFLSLTSAGLYRITAAARLLQQCACISPPQLLQAVCSCHWR